MWFGTDSNLVCKFFMSPATVKKRVSPPNKLQSVTSIILDQRCSASVIGVGSQVTPSDTYCGWAVEGYIYIVCAP